MERDLGHSMNARVSYRGSMSTQLPVFYNLNLPQASPSDLSNVYNYSQWIGGNINYESDGAIQRSNALDAMLQRKFAKGVQLQVAYTYTKSMTNCSNSDGENCTASNPYDLSYDWGNNTLIPRQRFVPTVLWEIPFGKGKAWGANAPSIVNAALGGWEISTMAVFQSGTYFSPTYDASSIPQGQSLWLVNRNGAANRPNCTGADPYTGNSGWYGVYLNAAAFSIPTGGTYGNCPANSLVGPGAWSVNMGVHKSFNLTEKATLKVEGNFMNLFNHPNPANPNTDLSSSGFGQITSTQNGNQLLSPTTTSNNGERHVWVGARVQF